MIELLIELHCHIESFGNEETKNLEKDIWEELKNYSKRREFMTWGVIGVAIIRSSKKDRRRHSLYLKPENAFFWNIINLIIDRNFFKAADLMGAFHII